MKTSQLQKSIEKNSLLITVDSLHPDYQSRTRYNGVHVKGGELSYNIIPTKYAYTLYINDVSFDVFEKLSKLGFDVKAKNEQALTVRGIGMNHINQIINELEKNPLQVYCSYSQSQKE